VLWLLQKSYPNIVVNLQLLFVLNCKVALLLIFCLIDYVISHLLIHWLNVVFRAYVHQYATSTAESCSLTRSHANRQRSFTTK